jgi:AMMECR1 domain-containing protein
MDDIMGRDESRGLFNELKDDMKELIGSLDKKLEDRTNKLECKIDLAIENITEYAKISAVHEERFSSIRKDLDGIGCKCRTIQTNIIENTEKAENRCKSIDDRIDGIDKKIYGFTIAMGTIVAGFEFFKWLFSWK